MGDILQSGLRDDHLRRQTAAQDVEAGYQNATSPPRTPGFRPKSQVYFRTLMQFADDNERESCFIDDIDADSDTQITTTAADGIGSDRSGNRAGVRYQPAVTKMEAMGSKEPPLVDDATPNSSQPQMSCRLSRFPFTHPCDIPELIYDQDEEEDLVTLNNGPSPLPSGPATPSVVNDIFRPLTEVFKDSPNLQLNLGPFSPIAPQAGDTMTSEPQMRKMSVRTLGSEMTDNLGMIREEEDDDDRNTDGVSMLSCTESSFSPTAEQLSGDHFGRHGSGLRPLVPSISSSGSTGSGEWRLANQLGNHRENRKSASLFSRMRNRNAIHEEPLERRSLTPYEISAPTPRLDDDDDHLAPDMPPPPTASSDRTATTHGETFTASKFFNFGRVAWFPDAQQKKREGNVFGVDLSQSIKTAPMKIRISHRGRSTSYRTFPLSVYKCSEFIRKTCNAEPTKGNVFSSPGNAFNVSQLKEMFNQSPMYGENFEFEASDYTVYDAARLIILFLEELPKPLISSSVIRSWVQLARQDGAIEPPAPRVETGLDFWTEALNRLPTASRNLTKHLLSLFADILIAKAGEVTEVDARHLASAVSRALFHQDTEPSVTIGRATSVNGRSTEMRKKANKKNAHPTLALAFLIKKRGEYAHTLKKATGMGDPNHKGVKKDPQFLPSTKEMLDWKNTPPVKA